MVWLLRRDASGGSFEGGEFAEEGHRVRDGLLGLGLVPGMALDALDLDGDRARKVVVLEDLQDPREVDLALPERGEVPGLGPARRGP